LKHVDVQSSVNRNSTPTPHNTLTLIIHSDMERDKLSSVTGGTVLAY